MARPAPTLTPDTPPEIRLNSGYSLKSRSTVYTVKIVSHALNWPFAIYALLMVAFYACVWVLNFKYIFGHLADDYYIHYWFSVAAANDWLNVFRVGNDFNHAYSLLTWLPVKLGWDAPTPSLLPYVSADFLGQYRALSEYMVAVHSVIALEWAFLFYRLTSRKAASLLALGMLLSSPTFVLWTSYLDSRLVWALALVPAIWLLLTEFPRNGGRLLWSAAKSFAIGLLVGLASSLNYTSIYLTIPLSLIFWGFPIIRSKGRSTSIYVEVLAYGIGLSFVYLVYLAIITYFNARGAQIPSLVDSYIVQWHHHSGYSLKFEIESWLKMLPDQLGIPMLLTSVVGGIATLITPSIWRRTPQCNVRMMVVTVLVGGPIIFVLPGNLPVFRQSAPFQPFLFFFAASALVLVDARISRFRWARAGTILLLAIVCAVPASKTIEAFNAILNPGRAVAWLEQNAGSRPLYWLAGEFRSSTSVYSWSDFTRMQESGLAIGIWPYSFLVNNPWARPILENTSSMALGRHINGTSTWMWEAGTFGQNWQQDKLLGQIRITPVSSILSQLPVLDVAEVSVGDDQNTKGSVLEGTARNHLFEDEGFYWSNSAQDPWVDVKLNEPATLSDLQLIEPFGTLIGRASVSGKMGDHWVTLWSSSQPITKQAFQNAVDLTWNPAEVSEIRLTVLDMHSVWGNEWLQTTNGIKNLSFPPYQLRLDSGPELSPLTENRLAIRQVKADSETAPYHTASKAIDFDVAPNQITDWQSTAQGGQHWLEVDLAARKQIPEMLIFNSTNSRINELTVSVRSDGQWSTIFEQSNLRTLPEILVSLPSTSVDAIRVSSTESYCGPAACHTMAIDELSFPGFVPFMIEN